MKKLITRIEYLWMRLKSKTPSLFNYANLFWVILVAVVAYLKYERSVGNTPESLNDIIDYAHLIIGVIGVILLKLPTKDKTLQSDLPIEEKVQLKKEEEKRQEPPIEDQVGNTSRFKR
jgi:hypothetical protein